MQEGVSVNVAKGLRPPLYDAVEEGHVEIIKFLLNNGAIVRGHNYCIYSKEETRLEKIAILGGNVEIIKHLKDYYGCNFDCSRDDYNDSFLSLAVGRYRSKAAKYLLENEGASVT